MAFPHDGRKFTQGQSGNPSGRPKGVLNAATRFQRWLTTECDVVNPATNQTERATIIERMDIELIKKALAGDIAAYREILDRVEGKPLQRNRHQLDSEDEINEVQITIIRERLTDKLAKLNQTNED